MSFEKAKAYLESLGYGDRIREYGESCATVALAAKAIGCEECEIAKSLTFSVKGEAVMTVVSGQARIDNAKFKAQFGVKPTMLKPDEVAALIGHGVGGVCPFAVKDGVKIFLDESLRRFNKVYPACGNSNSVVELSLTELEEASGACGWVDVSKQIN
jgi:prolyl-tRNA editing enzyme YbaK/EbsC (Cys-tRNA(Pro) deacylase)